jgi:predicted AlkP superfamily pyrophosphatase or phosphodiesterase
VKRTVVLDVVGLSAGLLGPRTPRLSAFCGEHARIEPVTPAVTCAAQATYLTGASPATHGIVANGWYFRDLNEVWLWRQSNRLIQGDKIWDVARKRDPSFTCSNTFWWYAMATRADVTLTPRPLYGADGLKLPDFYAFPLALRDEFNERFGTFPLFEFWGPRTSIHSSAWIADAAMAVEEKFSPSLQLVYLPHLDYCLQRLGPDGDIERDLAEIDDLCGRLIDYFSGRGCRVIVLSEYGITPVRRPVHVNRVLREAGLLGVKVDLGLETLDTGSSRAFAVSDHQIAHVYIENPADVEGVRALFDNVAGVRTVLGEDGKREVGLDHARSGELVLLAEPDSWFTYYFWLDDAVAPDYARMVDIHRKPGFDPVELFIDPDIRHPMLKVGGILARKALGFRYKMDLTPLDATLVKGSHGVVTGEPHNTPIFASSEPRLLDSNSLQAIDVQSRILDHLFRD